MITDVASGCLCVFTQLQVLRYLLNNPGKGTDPMRIEQTCTEMDAVCSWNSSSVLSRLFFYMSCCWVQNRSHALQALRQGIEKLCSSTPRAETPQNMQVNCWTLDLHPQFCSTAAGSVWSTLSKAVWSSIES